MGAAGPSDTGVWKWVAAILASVLIAGTPGLVYATQAPSREEVQLIRERQQEVLQRLARIETRLDNLEQDVQAVRDAQARQGEQLNAHITGEITSGRR